MADEFAIHGLDAAVKKLETLGPKLRKKAIGEASKRAMKIVKDAAIVGAKRIDDPATAAAIYKEIAIGTKDKLSTRGYFVTKVGVQGGSSSYSNTAANRGKGRVGESYKTGGNVWYWRLIEFGFTNWKSGEHIAARPFMRPAFSHNVEAVTARFTTEINSSLDRILAGPIA